MNKGDLVNEVAKRWSAPKKRPRKWWGVKKEGYGYPDWVRDL